MYRGIFLVGLMYSGYISWGFIS